MKLAAQPAILAAVPAAARYLTYTVTPGLDPRPALVRLSALADGDAVVVGVGAALASALGARIAGLRCFPAIDGAHEEIPATPAALWVWLRGEARGELYHRGREVGAALGAAFTEIEAIDAFRHREGRDLTGYEDGTENPDGDDALAAAIVGADGAAPAGSSFVAVQRWTHRFDRFDAMTPDERDRAIGRRLADNEELADAPASAHVRRTAQESFAPEAFVLRRSMPWTGDAGAGLMFVAFGRSFDAFEAQLRRMSGAEDGIADALFRFTRPRTGGYFWCPPLAGGRADLSALGI
ncbi:MAG: Dyp-type peroxidase [Burkholderiaceae bacterium]